MYLPPCLMKDPGINPLPTNDAYMRHELPFAHKNLYGGLILGTNTLYRLFCFKLFPMVGRGLKAIGRASQVVCVTVLR